ncbi:hypothetical protein DFS33DRAFT_1384305 [Desarmillaria ectypa]|nr:hypothetical protein DFS33DRAFT_1384305 [Desarmillaria ectypa]
MPKDTESVVIDSYPVDDGHLSLRKRLQVVHNPSSYAPANKWFNRDMDPTPPEDQTWGIWNYIAYWICGAFSISIWEQGSSMFAVGLKWKLSIFGALTLLATSRTPGLELWSDGKWFPIEPTHSAYVFNIGNKLVTLSI